MLLALAPRVSPTLLRRVTAGGGASLLRARAPHVVRRTYHAAAPAAMSFQGPGSEVLRGMSCAGLCSKDTPTLTEAEVAEGLKALPAWQLSEDQRYISRQFVARNFTAAVKFFEAVAEVADAEGHHPDLHLTNYRDVRVDLSTHAIGGLSKADLILAAKLDALPVEYSPKWLEKQQGAAGAKQ